MGVAVACQPERVRPMGVNPKEDDESRSSRVAWMSTIQLIIRGAVAIILELISRGRLPF